MTVEKPSSYYKGDLIENLLYFIPEYFGIEKSKTSLEISWNELASQVEMKMILKKDVPVKIGNEKFNLEKGEQVLLARSVKFTEWTLTKLLSDIGFRTEFLTTTADRGYVLSMIQPTRYDV